MASFWLLKSEPSTYSFADLKKDRSTGWNGIRNFQARNFLKTIKKGDLALIYHSGEDKAAVGLAKVTREAYPEKSEPDWVQVDIEYVKELKKPVTLAQMKAEKALSELKLLRQSRLSVVPVSKEHFAILMKLAETSVKV